MSAFKDFGIAASQNKLYQASAEDWFACDRRFARECVVEKAPLSPSDFGLRQRQKLDDLHAPRKGFRDSRYRHQVGRTGQEKAPGALVFVNLGFDRQKQFRRSLNFVDDGAVDVAEKTDRICFCKVELGRIVERQEWPVLVRNFGSEGCFAGLARTCDQSDARVSQSFFNALLAQSRIHEDAP